MSQTAEAALEHAQPDLDRLAKAELERSGLRLVFPSVLEARYERDIAAERVKELRFIVLWGATLYFILGVLLNLTIIPNPDWLQVWIQLGAPSLIGLVLRALFLRTTASSFARETALLAGCLGCTLAAILIVAVKPAPATLRDFLLAIPPASFVLIFVRLRFLQALAFFLANVGVYALTLSSRPEISHDDAMFLIGFMSTLLLPALLGAHSFERASRRIYLHGLLDRLRNENLTATNAALADLSYTDPLTNIPNRRQLDKTLGEFLAQPAAAGALLLADIDLFKAFNDRHGHLAGDACLRQVAQCLQSHLRHADLLTRFGGEEFAVLLPQSMLGEAIQTAERLRAAVQGLRLAVPGQMTNVTISIGITPRTGLDTAEALIGAADAALYAAKHAGRNRVEVARTPMPSAA
ncbi:GGDEF domain-containing protein [Bordetella sp. LUAb4]|uniref:GGDEF domain-containing protein n=1 Tax=Bordetella sp. LUAb4 TaxID=2843195 RepID=UPI001E5C6B1C|nr:GGDEF domain-containing protein [Bordetella sp. LUAb4]